MFNWLFNKKAQNTAEYAILIGLVVAAVMTIQVYVKNGLQGKIKDAVDFTGSYGEVAGANFAFTGDQYDPGFSKDVTSKTVGDQEYTIATGGSVTTGVTDLKTEQEGEQSYDYSETE